MTSSATALDAVRGAKEVATFTALVLIQCKGDPAAALEMLGILEQIADEGRLGPKSIMELDCVHLSRQAIRETAAMRGEE